MRLYAARLPELCRGSSSAVMDWIEQSDWRWITFCSAVIVLGMGVYGATIGLWRAGLMALYVGIKLPLLIFLTTICNAALNWMLALAMGAGIGFRQTLLTQLMAYAVAALILASLAPITLFILFNTPPMESGNPFGHRILLLLDVGLIALAGIAANTRLYRFLLLRTGHRGLARRVFTAWLAGNLFVGAQLSWNLRPFIGSPALAVQFLRPNPFEGNFYEAVYRTAKQFMTRPPEKARP